MFGGKKIVIKIKNLSISYGNKKVINGVNLEFRKNSITAIIGESGTGKTSVGLSLLGLNKGDISGEIIVKDEDILKYSAEEMKKYRWNTASIVFQNTGQILNPTVKIVKQIAESMIEHKIFSKPEAFQQGKKLLLLVGLEESYHDFYPAQLSGGQIQKALVAMALANDPDILVLDEPTSALDPLTKMEMIQLIKRVAKDKTVVLITHDFSVARSLAEKIVVLYGSSVVEMGEANKVLNEPVHPYTRGLLRSYPNMSTTKDLQGIRGTIQYGEKGCPFVNRCTQRKDICFHEKPELQEIRNRLIACHQKGIICLLRGEGIVKKYRKRKILKDVDFQLYEGETLCVVGESGSGKTTLAKCIMGLEKIDHGKLFYCEEKIHQNKGFYQQVQVIYQNPQASINRNFNVLTAVKEPLDIYKIGNEEEKKREVLKVLKEVNLPVEDAFLNQFPHELSGGESQRVAIARALILKPKLLIADEATSALDVSVQAKIMKLFMELQEKRGLTLLFITHDIALARKVSDKMIVLKNGEVVEEGRSAVMTNNPIHAYTKKLISAAPQIF